MAFDLDYDYDACLVRHLTVKISDIQDLKEWVQSLELSSTIPKDITDKQLLVFHLACQQNLNDTKKCIKIHFKLKARAPELFDNRDPSTDDMMQVQEVQEHMFLPVRTDEGYGVLMHRLHNFEVEKYNFSVACKYYSMSLDAHINENGPDEGIILLFDMQGVKLGHIARVSIGALAKYLAFVQEGLQARIISIHVINVVPLFDKIVLHPPNMDWEEFYRDAIPKKCLPSDFGGDLADTQTLHKLNTEISRLSLKMAFDLAYDYDACFVSDQTLKQSEINDLKKWADTQDQDNLIPKDMTEKQLLLFYIACQRNMTDTIKCIALHYNLKAKSPDMFDNRKFDAEEILTVRDAQEYIYLPEKTVAGHGIIFHRLHDPSLDKYVYLPNTKYFNMSVEAKLNEDGPDDGVILLFDMAKSRFAHLTKVPIGVMKRYLAFAQEGMHVRIVSIHILNVTTLFSAILQLIRPFMKGELIKRMVVHSPDMDWEAFTETSFQKNAFRQILAVIFKTRRPSTDGIGRDLQETKNTLTQKRNREKTAQQAAKKNLKIETDFNQLNID